MCGIIGWFSKRNLVDRLTLETARDILFHRGPDDHGIHLGEYNEAGLGFRRLAIIDLSENGHQPMTNEDGSVWLIFNGEIYNYSDIRPQLEQAGHHFTSQTDSEVIIHAYEEWGVDCLQRFNGMFAFTIWDTNRDRVFAARDRLGIKPLYFSNVSGELILSSELKALQSLPAAVHDINPTAIYDYLRHGYISAPNTIYQNVYHLEPGHYLVWDRQSDTLNTHCYWNIQEQFTRSREDFLSREFTDDEVCDELDSLLRQSVKHRLVSDVPLGAFLSGGIDSSLIVSLMRAVSTSDTKTYTIRFDDEQYNEADYAAQIAQVLGTQHHELTCTMDEAKALIPQIPTFYDEPYSDKSALPTFLVSKLARDYVTVALSGDGGDELFAGYNSYQWPLRYGNLWQSLTPFRPAIKGLEKLNWFSPKMQKHLNLFGSSTPSHMFDNRLSLWRHNELRELAPTIWNHQQDNALREPRLAEMMDSCMLYDLQHYLPHDILTKVDRVSMAVSLEVRVPILDHNVVEFAMGLPLKYKVRDGKRKYLLKKTLAKYLSPELTKRPKQGFSVPVAKWLHGNLNYLIDEHLNPDSVRAFGVVSPEAVSQVIQSFNDGKDGYNRVWNLLILHMWFNNVRQKHEIGSINVS